MRDSWIGDIEIGDRWARWTGLVGDSCKHRHFSAQAILSSEPITVSDAAGMHTTAHLILIDPLVPHRVEPGTRAQLIFVEPPYRPAAVDALLRSWCERHQPAIVATADHDGFWTGWLRTGSSAVTRIDPRVAAATAAIDARLEDGPLRLSDFAADAGLSPERFRHLFAQELQTPFRRFILWRRLVRAAAALRAGGTVTAAAHVAGFADAAHFARVLKTSFGIRATQALTRKG